MWKNDSEKERVVLVGIGASENDENALSELSELVEAAGAEVAATVLQQRDRPDPATYIGSGKLAMLRMVIEETGAGGIVCDDELTPAQLRILSRELPCKVMDRTLVILDIFAARANTGEGKIQVELAQLQHRMTHLSGLGTSLSRLGGGIGTRGPGEKKLETDRRLIRKRITHLKEQLRGMKGHRALLREGRSRKNIPVAAIVGYTNAGKSTLLNTLTGSSVMAEDQLFATLDPATRLLKLKDGQEVLLTDTVGFIQKLPHHLVDAFRSTLEEAKYADIILHVVDASEPEPERRMHVVYETLRDLGVRDKKSAALMNKSDLPGGAGILRDPQADATFRISALTGEGTEEVLDWLSKVINEDLVLIERRLTYDKASVISLIRRYGRILEEEYTDEGIRVKAYVPMEIYGRL